MPENQTFRTRFALKTNTTTEWTFNSLYNTFIPLKGEMIVYQDKDKTRVKIGDGVTLLRELPFTAVDTIDGVDISEFALRRDLQIISRVDFTATLIAENWLASDNKYLQTIKIEGITDKDVPIIELDLRDSNNAIVEKSNWNYIDYANTLNGEIAFYCVTKCPSVNLKINGCYYTSTAYDQEEPEEETIKIEPEIICEPSFVQDQVIVPSAGYDGIGKVVVKKCGEEDTLVVEGAKKNGTTNFVYDTSTSTTTQITHNLNEIPRLIKFTFTDSEGEKQLIFSYNGSNITDPSNNVFTYSWTANRTPYTNTFKIILSNISATSLRYRIAKTKTGSQNNPTPGDGQSMIQNVYWEVQGNDTEIPIIRPIINFQTHNGSFAVQSTNTINCGFKPDIVYLNSKTIEGAETGIALPFSLMQDQSNSFTNAGRLIMEENFSLFCEATAEVNNDGFTISMRYFDDNWNERSYNGNIVTYKAIKYS